MIEQIITITYDNFKITNVPVIVEVTDGFEEKYYKGSVSLKFSYISDYMQEKGINEFNFNDYDTVFK